MLSTWTKHLYMSCIPLQGLIKHVLPSVTIIRQWHHTITGSNILEGNTGRKKKVAYPPRSININPWLVYFLSWNIHSCFFFPLSRAAEETRQWKKTDTHYRSLAPLIFHFVWWTSAFGSFCCSPQSQSPVASISFQTSPNLPEYNKWRELSLENTLWWLHPGSSRHIFLDVHLRMDHLTESPLLQKINK